jgi:hypothetical protein
MAFLKSVILSGGEQVILVSGKDNPEPQSKDLLESGERSQRRDKLSFLKANRPYSDKRQPVFHYWKSASQRQYVSYPTKVLRLRLDLI